MQYAKPKVYWLMLIGVIFSILNTSTSYAAPTCPSSDDRMYFIGNNPPTSAYEKQTLSNWTAGSTSKIYTFTDGAQATIKFENIKDVTNFAGTTTATPTYTTNSALGVGSIAIFHNSNGAVTNHSISLLVNKPVSRAGYVIHDLDSYNPGSGTAYQEQFDVSGSNGVLSLVNSNAQTINTSNNVITSRKDINCSNNGSPACPDDAVWSYSAANTAFKGNHNNLTSIANTTAHAVGYNDFFFCLSPPKLINQKILNGTRAQPSDQFTIATTGGTVNNSFTTAGTGSTIDAGTNQSSMISLTSGTSATYTITESITNSGSLTNYNTTYKCTNGTTSTSTMPSGNGSTFSLSNLNYGDEITCQVTNAPKAYTFSGIVFNDNGGLTLANDLSVPVGTNTTYFNGVYDSSVEKGITQAGLTIDLAKNCNATTPTIIQSAIVGSDGTYSISATSTQMANATNVCLIQREPNGNLTSYPVDTTNNQANITFASTTYDYQNINFGEVSQNNAGLVLVKEQATNDCNITNTDMLGLTYNAVTQSGIDARKCVAYRITAYNRTNLTNPLTNVRITDALPKKGVNTSTVTSTLVGPTDTTSNNFNINFNSGVTGAVTAFGQNGTVVSNVKSLDKGASMSLYFNTKYDSNLP